MEDFTMGGKWWLPESPEHVTSGELSYTSDGVRLVIHGSLVQTIVAPGAVLQQGPPDWENVPVILGRSYDGRNVSVLDAGGANFIGSHVNESHYEGGVAIKGAHVSDDLFSETWCTFDALSAWADPPAIAIREGSTEFYKIDFKDREIALAEIEAATIRLIASATGSVNQAAVSATLETMFVVTFKPEPLSAAEILNTWIRYLQDLLLLALGRPVRLTKLYLRPKLHDSQMQVGKPNLAEAFFSAIQPNESDVSTSIVQGYSAPTLFTYKDAPEPFGSWMPKWVELRTRLREVFTLLNTPHYAPFLFNEHRYSSMFQSAESLAHAKGYSGREKSRLEHRQRVESILAAARAGNVAPETIAWAERVLRSRNDKPLRQQIEDLVRSTGRVGEFLLEARPNFGELATSFRTGVSHGGASQDVDNIAQYWCADVLRWIVRVRVLEDLGFTQDDIAERVFKRAQFRFAVEQLRVPT